MTHECDRQRDGRTDILVANVAPNCAVKNQDIYVDYRLVGYWYYVLFDGTMEIGWKSYRYYCRSSKHIRRLIIAAVLYSLSVLMTRTNFITIVQNMFCRNYWKEQTGRDVT